MGYTSSTVHGISVPDASEANNVPEDIQNVVTALEAGSLIKRLSQTSINALTGAQKPAGLVVYNTTTSKLQISNGSTFADVDAAALAAANAALPKSGGTMSGAIAMGSQKITGLASGTVSTDAVNKGQVDAVSTTASAALPKSGGTMTGAIAMGGAKITGLAAASANGDAVRYEQPLMKTGGTMSGAIAMGSQKITGLANGTSSADAVNKSQLDTVDAIADSALAAANAALPKAGGTMSGAIAMGSNKVTGLTSGTVSTDAVNKGQLDAVSTVANAALPKAGGTMTGAIAMGNNKVTGLAAASANGDAVRYEQALLKAGGTMSGNIAMGGNKVTGLAAASANGDAVRYEQVVATYAEMERPSGTQSIPNGTTTVTYSTETDPSSIANTGTGRLSLTAGVWTLSYFSAVQGGDSYSHYLYAGSRTVDYGYGQTVGLNATVYLSGSTTVYAQIVNASSATTVALARLTAVRIGI